MKIGERGRSYARDLYDWRGQSSKSEETENPGTVAVIRGSEETESRVAAWRGGDPPPNRGVL